MSARKLKGGEMPDWPRLMPREMAAAYCGISVNHFETHIAPALRVIEIGRRKLYHRSALTRWVDQFAGEGEALPPTSDWLGALDGDSREGR